jgi:hypothetical protein
MVPLLELEEKTMFLISNSVNGASSNWTCSKDNVDTQPKKKGVKK